MKVETDDQALIDLYQNGTTSDRRYRSLPPQVVRKYRLVVGAMRAAMHPEHIAAHTGWRFEPLKGDLRGYHSVRLNQHWRLIFRICKDGAISITSIKLIEISSHYDD